jgi:hypothetical protein
MKVATLLVSALLIGAGTSAHARTFFDWCTDAQATLAQKATVQIMLYKAGATSNTTAANCHEAEETLLGHDFLDLWMGPTDPSMEPLTDLAPVASLSQLRTLSIAHQQVVDISPLVALSHLQSLNLYDNRTADISPLAALAELTNLTLDDNRVRDLAPLGDALNLQYLGIDGNRVCALPDSVKALTVKHANRAGDVIQLEIDGADTQDRTGC